MFVRYTENLCLNDWNDVIEIKNDTPHSIGGFVRNLELKPGEIIYIGDDIVKNIPVVSGDLILFTVRQGKALGETTDAELYIKKANEIILVFGSSTFEENAEIKNLKAYEMYCYLAKRICGYYNLLWEYRDDIDAPEKVKPNKLLRILVIVFFVISILRIILDFIH